MANRLLANGRNQQHDPRPASDPTMILCTVYLHPRKRERGGEVGGWGSEEANCPGDGVRLRCYGQETKGERS